MVRLNGRLDMTIDVDWDVKPQHNNNNNSSHYKSDYNKEIITEMNYSHGTGCYAS